LPPKNASFDSTIEREGGIFEKIMNQSFTLPNDGYDARTSLPFHLTVTLFPTTIMISTFSAENGHVFAREVEEKHFFF
jgi:hypothetical protein